MAEKKTTQHDLENCFKAIQALDGLFMTLNYEMPGIYQGKYGIFFLTVAQRTTQLCRSYILLAKANFYTTAAALIRMQLDNALRTYGLLLAADKEQFVSDFLLGKRISNFKTSKGERLQDHFLKTALNNWLKGVEPLYDKTSGYIHLSHQHHHHHSRMKYEQKTLKLEIELSGVDDITMNKKTELTNEMIQATNFVKETLLLVHHFCS